MKIQIYWFLCLSFFFSIHEVSQNFYSLTFTELEINAGYCLINGDGGSSSIGCKKKKVNDSIGLDRQKLKLTVPSYVNNGMSKFKVIFLFIPILLISACSPDEELGSEDSNLLKCHLQEGWPTADVAEHLVGSWRWVYKKCPGAENGQNYLEYKGQVIEFYEDFTLVVINDGALPESGTYAITSNGNYYGLNTTPEIPSLQGRIFFCLDEMEANQELDGGCNNYLRKYQ